LCPSADGRGAAKVKAHEFEEFQTVKDLEIQNMQE
jgi:hypothetical protein